MNEFVKLLFFLTRKTKIPTVKCPLLVDDLRVIQKYLDAYTEVNTDFAEQVLEDKDKAEFLCLLVIGVITFPHGNFKSKSINGAKFVYIPSDLVGNYPVVTIGDKTYYKGKIVITGYNKFELNSMFDESASDPIGSLIGENLDCLYGGGVGDIDMSINILDPLDIANMIISGEITDEQIDVLSKDKKDKVSKIIKILMEEEY